MKIGALQSNIHFCRCRGRRSLNHARIDPVRIPTPVSMFQPRQCQKGFVRRFTLQAGQSSGRDAKCPGETKERFRFKCAISSNLIETERERFDELGEHRGGRNDNDVGEKLEGLTSVDGRLHSATVEEAEKMYNISFAEKEPSVCALLTIMDPHVHKNMLEALAEENISNGVKLFIDPPVVKPDQVVQIFFNRNASCLANEPDVFIMGAFNDWRWKPYTCQMQKSHLRGDWWCCHVHFPKEAYKMDFVFFNGKSLYDNNHFNNFVVPVEGGMDSDDFDTFLIEEKRKEREEAAMKRAKRQLQSVEQCRHVAEITAKEFDRKIARMEIEKEKKVLQEAIKIASGSASEIWHIEPALFKGQDTVKLFYNRSLGPLTHANEIWIHCGYNNWKDGVSILGRLSSSEKEGGDWWYVDVVVPERALVLDWVLADGPPPCAKLYDNNNYEDFHAVVSNAISEENYWLEEEFFLYSKLQEDRKVKDEYLNKTEYGDLVEDKIGMRSHILVSGDTALKSPMHIVHIAVEMAPIAKVGGLADVVTSLSRAVQDLGHIVEIIVPKYACMNTNNVAALHLHQSFSWGGTKINIWLGKVEGLPVYFLDPQNGMFSAGNIYGCRNDGERFGFFCHASLEFLFQNGASPDILHCHDWSSAPVAWLFKEHYRYHGFNKTRVIFTIHNLEFGAHFISKAMAHADKATTVSRTYSKEVSQHPSIAPFIRKFHGITNGIDPDIWDPCNDKFIPISYSSDDVTEGKKAAKEALQQRFGLKRRDCPLVGIITRLTYQKGIHLIKHAIGQALQKNGQVVLLGSAPDPRIQHEFSMFAHQLHSSHGDMARVCLTYDEPLSHLIYAASDFIVVPSIFEPCGLTQLIAMRYGSIPVVRKTGGLHDTIFDVDDDNGRAKLEGIEPNGFCFHGADASGVDYALNRALDTWFNEQPQFVALSKRVMEQDWSWNRPALEYMDLYLAALEQN